MVATLFFIEGRKTATPIVTTTQIEKLVPVTTYVDKDSNKHEVVVTKALTQKELEFISDSIRKSIKASEIISIGKQTQRIDTVFKEVPVYVDSVTHEIFCKDSTKYTNISFKGNSKLNKGVFYIDLTDSLTEIVYLKKHLLKATDEYIDLQHSNPYFTTTSAYQIHRKEPKNILTFGIGMFVSADGVLHPGVGIVYNCWSLKSK
jgi:hypothetical protein